MKKWKVKIGTKLTGRRGSFFLFFDGLSIIEKIFGCGRYSCLYYQAFIFDLAYFASSWWFSLKLYTFIYIKFLSTNTFTTRKVIPCHFRLNSQFSYHPRITWSRTIYLKILTVIFLIHKKKVRCTFRESSFIPLLSNTCRMQELLIKFAANLRVSLTLKKRKYLWWVYT